MEFSSPQEKRTCWRPNRPRVIRTNQSVTSPATGYVAAPGSPRRPGHCFSAGETPPPAPSPLFSRWKLWVSPFSPSARGVILLEAFFALLAVFSVASMNTPLLVTTALVFLLCVRLCINPCISNLQIRRRWKITFKKY